MLNMLIVIFVGLLTATGSSSAFASSSSTAASHILNYESLTEQCRVALEARANLEPGKEDAVLVLRIVGAAKKPQSDIALYCELHYQNADNPTSWLVEYWQGNQVLANKYLDYTSGETSPAVKQEDFRSGEQRIAVLDGGWSLEFIESEGIASESKNIGDFESIVIDAGFDAYVREHWPILTSGKRLKFEFASIPHLRSLKLKAEKTSTSRCVNASAEDICIAVGAANRLLSLFVGKLYLTYDSQQRLKVFSGVVNIDGDDGKSQEANIFYTYH